MYSKLPRKTSPTKLALNKSPSRLPTPSTSRIPFSKRSAGASPQGKENVTPFSKKQGSSRSAPLKKIVANKHKGVADLGDVKCVGSIAKDEKAFTRPVLADLSLMTAEASMELDFDEDWETGLDAATISTPKKKRTVFCHNDSIEVTRKRSLARLSRGDSAEADISLDAVPNSLTERIEYIEPVDYFGDAEVEDKRYNDSIEVTRKRSLTRLARGGDVKEADISLDAVPDSLTERIQYIEPAEYFDDAEAAADDTFDLSEMLDKLDAPQERLMDTSLSDLMNVEINYSLEFPNTAIGRPPHIFVAKYKRDKKRAALENQKNRCVLQDECIIDAPLQDWAPSFNWKVLKPEQYKASIQNIPTLIVTSPSNVDLASLMNRNNPTVEYDEEIIESGLYKYFPLDASLRNWMIRFHGVIIDEEDEEEEDLNEIY